MLVFEPLGLVYFTYSTMHKHCQYCNLQPTMWRMADKFPLTYGKYECRKDIGIHFKTGTSYEKFFLGLLPGISRPDSTVRATELIGYIRDNRTSSKKCYFKASGWELNLSPMDL